MTLRSCSWRGLIQRMNENLMNFYILLRKIIDNPNVRLSREECLFMRKWHERIFSAKLLHQFNAFGSLAMPPDLEERLRVFALKEGLDPAVADEIRPLLTSGLRYLERHPFGYASENEAL